MKICLTFGAQSSVWIYNRSFEMEAYIKFTGGTLSCDIRNTNITTPVQTLCGFTKGGLSLVGCGDTAQGIDDSNYGTLPDTTALGFSAGKGIQTTGAGNTFIGYEAGKNTTTEEKNTFIGYQAGENNEADENTFIGYQAGQKNTTGTANTFVGYWAGSQDASTHSNTLVGFKAGYQIEADSNTFVGSLAGQRTTTGKSNTFIGRFSGSANTTGKYNVFIGQQSGYENTTGEGNIFIGTEAANNSSYKTASDKFVVGNTRHTTWIEADIGTNTFEIDGNQVSYDGHTHPLPPHTHPSSRTLKKNIKPFTDFQKALKDIITTPLFTFNMKKDNPEKSRMGIISEELPEHLQIKEKGKVSTPDWISIYGTFWASIKWLWEDSLNQDQEIKELKKELAEARKLIKKNKQELTEIRKQIDSQLLCPKGLQKPGVRPSEDQTLSY